jgi:hypothetical protein
LMGSNNLERLPLETTELIYLFPEDYPASKTYAIYEEEQEAQALADWKLEQYIARNFGDCGRSLNDFYYDDRD